MHRVPLGSMVPSPTHLAAHRPALPRPCPGPAPLRLGRRILSSPVVDSVGKFTSGAVERARLHNVCDQWKV